MDKIILIEDREEFLEILKLWAEKNRPGQYLIISAQDVESAEKIIRKNLDARAIILDGNIIGGQTIGLLKKIRPIFGDLIFAFSADLQDEMMAAGADIAIQKTRLGQVFQFL